VVEDVAGVVQAIFLGNRLLASSANVMLIQRLLSFLELESEETIAMPTSFSSFSLPGEEDKGGEGQAKTAPETENSSASSIHGKDSTLRDQDDRRIRLTKAVVSTLEVR
jgi:hypothetical protein